METSIRSYCLPTLIVSLGLTSMPGTVRSAEIIDYGVADLEDINESGQIAGKTFISNAGIPALWPSGSTTPQPLAGNGFSSGGFYAIAYSINEAGQATGGALYQGFINPRAFLWQDEAMIDLGSLETGANSLGNDLNDAGQVAGWAYTEQPGVNEHAFLWEGGTMQDLGTFGGTRSFGIAINASGQVLVRAVGFTVAPTIRAFLWSDDAEPRELVSTLEFGVSEPWDLNDLGQAIGYSQAGGPPRTTVWQGGQALDLGRDGLSTLPIAINNHGHIVGYAIPNGGSAFAVIWHNGRLQDLCVLVNCATAGWTLMRANGISDRGDIVGRGTIGGQSHGFLLRGVAPQPYTSGLVAAVKGVANASLVARLRSPTGSGPVAVERVNTTTGAALTNVNYLAAGGFSGRQVVSLANIGGTAAEELAVLATRNTDGQIRAEIRDADSRALLKSFTLLSGAYQPVWLFEVPDLDGNGKVDLGLLAIRKSDGRALVKLAGSLSGATIGALIYYSTGLVPLMAEALPDLDGSGQPEIAVLAEDPVADRYRVQIRNALGAAAPRNVTFAAGSDPLQLAIGPDKDNNGVPELAVLARQRSDGRALVEMRNAYGAAAVKRVFYSPDYAPVAFAQAGDTDSNTVPEWALLLDRDSNHRPYTQLRNQTGAAGTVTRAYLNTAYRAQQLVVLPDSDSLGGPDIGVIAQRSSDGRLRMEIRNARGGGTTRAFFFSP